MRVTVLPIVAFFAFAIKGAAQLPPPPTLWSPWSMNVTAAQPCDVSADGLLEKPAGRDGPIVVRDGHFYSGNNRVRFWGVNIAFSANFPPHEEADKLASRFARYGINAVRFHHMDNQPYPNGIFADASLDALSPTALERLDYFIAALKRNGIYSDLNLHVSRSYSHYHKDAGGKDGPAVDKIVDLFDPDLIAAQKQYASDLLQHFNVYTHARYADDPAVGIVEINNENSLFMWNADRTLNTLPAVYAVELAKQWNRWLSERYGTREHLKSAWALGEERLGASIATDGDFASFDAGKKPGWILEQYHNAKMKVSFDKTGAGNGKAKGVVIDVTALGGADGDLQLSREGLHIQKGEHYTLQFDARSDQPMPIGAAVGECHEPWRSDGLSATVMITPRPQTFSLPFDGSQVDYNGRILFVVGRQIGHLYLSNVSLLPGGRMGLTDDENAINISVQTPMTFKNPTPQRRDDWYNFLQQTEEKYYTGMMKYLKTDIGVKCPITGTIGFGPMGTLTQSKMDFVDAHAYWEHPSFPHKQWDPADWTTPNQAMVDHPDIATLWSLGATRVAGKPFTVTEYQHPAPNDWQAECIPFIATYAALQDWDGVFLFAYSHNFDYDKNKISGFFDIEGNPTKMPLMPMGARLFSAINAFKPQASALEVTPDQVVKSVPEFSGNQGAFLRDVVGVDLKDKLNTPAAIRFSTPSEMATDPNRAVWTATGAGTGRFIVGDPSAAVFVGFANGAMPIDLSQSQVRIESLSTPFATIIVVPASPTQHIGDADRLLISAVARAQNTGMQWDKARHTVGTHWGEAPTQIEVVNAVISLPGEWKHAMALDAAGRPVGKELSENQGERTNIKLGTLPTVWYEVTR
jgi:hypothetical protein